MDKPHMYALLPDDPDLQETWDMGPPSPVPDLHGKPEDEVVELVVEWFFSNFEDPANRTPYEGGYIYIWGGPYSAEEEIRDAFPESIGEAAVVAAVEEIEHDGYEWVPAENRMMPEQPSDPVVQAKRRIHQQIEAWVEVDGSADPGLVKVLFRIADVALLLREHRRLSEILSQVRMVVAGGNGGTH